MLNLIGYNRSLPSQVVGHEDGALEKRFRILTEACEGSVSLVAEVEKLRSAFLRQAVMP